MYCVIPLLFLNVFTCLYMYMKKRSYTKIIEMVSLGGVIASNCFFFYSPFYLIVLVI